MKSVIMQTVVQNMGVVFNKKALLLFQTEINAKTGNFNDRICNRLLAFVISNASKVFTLCGSFI